MRIGIVVDNPTRDLTGGVLLSRELASRGAEAILIPLYQQGTDVPLLGLDALVLNYARLNYLGIMRTYRELGVSLFVLDTEGGVLSEHGADAPESWAQSFRQNGFHELLEGYFFWGERVRNAFARYSGMAGDRLHVTGPPRYDLCAPRWRSVLGHHRRDYVLINTNFSAINPRFSRTEEAELSAFAAAGWQPDYMQQLLRDLKNVRDRYLNELLRLTRDNPGLGFVVRPHPFESRETYDRHFKGLPNVTVDPTGNIFNVINNATGVLHLNCGTAVESVLLGKLPIALEYLNTDIQRQHTPLPSSISFCAKSYDDLNRAVRSLDQATRAFDFDGVRREYIRPWFHEVDGQAAKRVGDLLCDFLKRRHGVAPAPKWTVSLRSSSPNPSLMQRLQGCVNNSLGSKWGSHVRNMVNPQWRHKAFDVTDVSGLLKALNNGGESSPMSVTAACHPFTRLPLSSIRCAPSVGAGS